MNTYTFRHSSRQFYIQATTKRDASEVARRYFTENVSSFPRNGSWVEITNDVFEWSTK